MKIERMPGLVQRFCVYLEEEEDAEQFLLDDWDSLKIPDEFIVDGAVEEEKWAEIDRGVILAGNGTARFFKGPYYAFCEAAGDVDDESPKILPWGGTVRTCGWDFFPKIPVALYYKVIEFFRKVEKEYKAEAYVSLWYSTKTGKWKIHVPKQEVSSAALDYEEQKAPFGEEFEYMGDIHSHSSMSAGHSGVDDMDEFADKLREGIHITLGYLDKPFGQQNWSARVIYGPGLKRTNLTPLDIIEYGKGDLRVPKAWMDQVTKKAIQVGTSATSASPYRGGTVGGHGSTASTSRSFESRYNAKVPDIVGVSFNSQGQRDWLSVHLEMLADNKEEEEELRREEEREEEAAIAVTTVGEADDAPEEEETKV